MGNLNQALVDILCSKLQHGYALNTPWQGGRAERQAALRLLEAELMGFQER